MQHFSPYGLVYPSRLAFPSFPLTADGQYMSFGISGNPSKSMMVGGDVVVAWLDQASGRGEAQDYYLGAKSQCQGGRGSCPDDELQVRES